MLTAFDYGALAIVLLSALQGMWRGVVAELFSLIGWIAALAVAVHFMGRLAPLLPAGLPGGDATRLVLAFVGLVVAVLVGAGICAAMLSKLTEAIGLRPLDRTLGLAFGALRGVIFVLVCVILAAFTPLPAQPFWRDAQLLPYAQTGVGYVRRCLPPALAQYIPVPPGDGAGPDGSDGQPGNSEHSGHGGRSAEGSIEHI